MEFRDARVYAGDVRERYRDLGEGSCSEWIGC